MIHQALARKWRPSAFEEVIGQEHVLQSLKNALNQGRLHSAYLFSGTRGVGKTTLARILAKALNCKIGISATPCNECDHCTAINQGKFPDFYEIDAASHTKVEDIRELLSNLPYAPIQGRFKVYLIDEVHMLSKHSFNALLKTLEEPPTHVMFIFATTDPDALPATILSRCLQFNLKSLTPSQITPHLANILKKEGVTFEEESLIAIAQSGKGSLRDALTLLNQAIAYSNGNLSAKAVHTLLGTIETNYLLELLEALKQENATRMMEITRELSEKNIDFQQLLQSLASIMHELALSNMAPALTSKKNPLNRLSNAFTLDQIQKYYQIILSGMQDLSLSPTPKMGTDMTLLRMLTVGKINRIQPTATAAGGKAPNHQLHQAISAATPTTKPPKPEKSDVAEKKEKDPPTAHQNEHIKAIMEAFSAKLKENTQ